MAFQKIEIPLDGYDRSGDGQEFAYAAGGGIFFDEVPVIGVTVRFDESRIEVPIRARRAMDIAFQRFHIVHPSGLSGTMTAYLYERKEGIYDSPSNVTQQITADIAQGWYRTGNFSGRYQWVALLNPATSGVNMTVLKGLVSQGASGSPACVMGVLTAGLPSANCQRPTMYLGGTDEGDPGHWIDSDRSGVPVGEIWGVNAFDLIAHPAWDQCSYRHYYASSNDDIGADDFRKGILLAPGAAFVILSAATSQQLIASIRWQEGT